MTFYNQQIQKLNSEIYSKEYLTKQIIQSKIFIDDHFENNITLAQIACEAFISKFHFIRLFKNYYGRTPYRYLTEVRIKEAKKLLRKGVSIKNVCISVGFDSPTSFAGLFKKITGLSPVAFQKNKKSNFEEH